MVTRHSWRTVRPPIPESNTPTGRGSTGRVYAGAMAAIVRVGTCSWADEALVKAFYPPKIPAGERLSWYAQHYDTVEVDSTYYRLPSYEMVARWAERTPDNFVMHVKAFGAMTRHPVKVDQLPPDLRDDAPLDDRGRLERPSREFRGELFRRFNEALEPLRETGKLGGILMQFPPYVVPREAAYDYLEWAGEQPPGQVALVDFRPRSWYEGEQLPETLALLERLSAAHVVVDAPQVDAKNVPPTVPAVTAPLTYVRFHGRNAGTWNVRGGSAAERFDYLYSDDELREWGPQLPELAGEAEEAVAGGKKKNTAPPPR